MNEELLGTARDRFVVDAVEVLESADWHAEFGRNRVGATARFHNRMVGAWTRFGEELNALHAEARLSPVDLTFRIDSARSDCRLKCGFEEGVLRLCVELILT